MNILFMTFLSPHKYLWGFQFGPGYLSAVLRQKGHKTMQILDSDFSFDVVEKTVRKQKTDLVCVSSTTDPVGRVKEVIPRISQAFDIPTVMGGAHATACPEDSVRIPGVLGACRGEGELALTEFVERLEDGRGTDNIMNFWFKHRSRIIRNPVRPLIGDLDSLPFPDRENFDYDGFLEHVSFGLEFSSSRGCPFDCAFCMNSTMRDIYGSPRNFLRRRSVDNVIREVREVVGRHHRVKHLYFHDDVFTADKRWLEEFSVKYPDEVGLPFRVNAHASLFDGKCAVLLKKAGCIEVEFGVETGDESLRMRVLGKNVTDSRLMAAFKAAHEAGLATRGFNMVGIPHETEESLKKTVEFNRMLGATHVNAPFFRPYPGTRLYDMCLEEGLFRGGEVGDPQNETMLKLPAVSDRRLYFYKRAFNLLHKYPWAEGFLNFADGIHVTSGRTVFDVLYSIKRGCNGVLGA